MNHLVLIRHGQSVENKAHRFSGWTDSPLTPKGIEDLRQAGLLLVKEGYEFDCCFTSVLSRSVVAGRLVLDAIGQQDLSLTQSWRLNERHFGALQEVGRAEAVWRYGLLSILRLQRSYTLQPPPLAADDPRSARVDPLYAKLPVESEDLPLTESLEDTYARVIPYWESTIRPELRNGRRVLVAVHKNSLRVLIQHIEGLSGRDTARLQLVTSQPIIYELDSQQHAVRRISIGKPARKFSRWTGISPA